MTVHIAIPATGAALLAVNLFIYVRRRHGTTYASRSAREFCMISFASFAAAAYATLDLATQPWTVSEASAPSILLHGAGTLLLLSTLTATIYAHKSRNPM
ncbi:MAG: hypothetical protein GAK28_04632 [Luteibacter sp.]|uniref:hypothetical protein n=1 Tax=Luteibacter sp. TaxID=1886636 RepID=UPI00137E784C|nr:hypothetical protein [Luteibacter sp.]KAF1003496.1 MAG: hypothetical protein GAK28_04632 [Luteibacter sp.]